MSDQPSPEPNERDHSVPATPDPTSMAQSSLGNGGAVEPMTLSLLGRLFGIPFLIIGVIVGGAVIVVFMFGAPTAQRDRTVDQLLTALEGGTGGKSLGMLLPRDKQHWQTGLELTMRLDKKDEFSDAQLAEVARRLGAVVQRELKRPAPHTSADGSASPDQEAYRQRMDFLIRALGKTGRPEAMDALLAVVSRGDEPLAAMAIAALGDSADVEGHERAIPLVISRMATARSAEFMIVACTALSVLADPADPTVVDALVSALRSREGEVGWSAALALARLGNDAGKRTLMDLLDRSFWESGKRYQVTNEAGVRMGYRMPKDRVDRYLIAAMEASSKLSDPEVWQMIETLQRDPHPSVRAKAAEIMAAHKQSGN